MIQELHYGVTKADRRGAPVLYRFIRPADSISGVTELLHRAYAPLAAAGMHYAASHQSTETTERRMAKGDTLVAVVDNRIIGVITLARSNETKGSPFYDRPDVARFGQFAVEPLHQNAGVGSTLLDFVEELAVERGVCALGLDTSENAKELIQLYFSRGYGFIEFVHWPDVNYRSVVLAKALTPVGLGHLTGT